MKEEIIQDMAEGEFIAKLVKPNITLWVSSDRTHSIGFDRSVREGKFAIVEEAIAHEYGFFAEYTKNLVIYNADNHRIEKEVKRTKAAKEPVFEKRSLDRYLVLKDKTEFRIDGKVHSFSDPLPKKTFYALAMTIKLMKFLEKPLDPSFSNFHSAPGRSSRFAGIKNITIIDSCYNANLGSMSTMLEFFESYPGEKKWAVVGDMLEQGEGERIEHEKLAEILSKMKLERIIFLGPRVSKYTMPKLNELRKNYLTIVAFENPRAVLEYLQNSISGGETIFFKGARFMEGIIEHLLADPKDIAKLSRREKIWEIRRKQWGL
jgi:UDP-N-acetylmuramoyl-tripeptide--D-alanyl-D-alanine ligase